MTLNHFCLIVCLFIYIFIGCAVADYVKKEARIGARPSAVETCVVFCCLVFGPIILLGMALGILYKRWFK